MRAAAVSTVAGLRAARISRRILLSTLVLVIPGLLGSVLLVLAVRKVLAGRLSRGKLLCFGSRSGSGRVRSGRNASS